MKNKEAASTKRTQTSPGGDRPRTNRKPWFPPVIAPLAGVLDVTLAGVGGMCEHTPRSATCTRAGNVSVFTIASVRMCS